MMIVTLWVIVYQVVSHTFISRTTILSTMGQSFKIVRPNEMGIVQDLMVCSWFFSKDSETEGASFLIEN